MNDFSKEELHILSEYLDYPVEEIAGSEGNRLQLVLKIQSMIEDLEEIPSCVHMWAAIFEPLPIASFHPEAHLAKNEAICMKCGIKYE